MLHKCYTVPDTHNMHLFYENDKLSIALLQLSKHVLECKKKKKQSSKNGYAGTNLQDALSLP